jgi:ribosomal protein S18 acetylase RimI-like enzyme
MHPLDNVIWHALTTRQTEFADAHDQARRFQTGVTSLAGISQPDDQGYDSLATLAGPGGTAALFLKIPYGARPGWALIAAAPLLQMVASNGVAKNGSHTNPLIEELRSEDSPEMIELTALTKPGPFGPRTHELGNYVGIRNQGTLVAMAGERLKVPGFTEVSAVCTHPDHTGKGYARVLMLEVMKRIRDRGETPFLHVREDNERAIKIYERLGFTTREITHLAVLRKS